MECLIIGILFKIASADERLCAPEFYFVSKLMLKTIRRPLCTASLNGMYLDRVLNNIYYNTYYRIKTLKYYTNRPLDGTVVGAFSKNKLILLADQWFQRKSQPKAQ